MLVFSPRSALKMEAVFSTRHYNPEDQHRYIHRRKKLKFHNAVTISVQFFTNSRWFTIHPFTWNHIIKNASKELEVN
jgi:hypothetical protein